MNSNRIVFITHSLSGHRLNWFNNIIEVQKNETDIIQIIALNDHVETMIHSLKLNVTYANSKPDAFALADNLFLQDKTINVVILDGESWLNFLFQTNLPIKVLFLRPFISSKSISSLLSFCAKRSIISMLYFKKNVSYRFLSVPRFKPFFYNKKWVQDDLTTFDLGNYQFENEPDRKLMTILVPGFISERKNPKLILDVANELQTRYPGSFRFQFMGSADARTKILLESSNLKDLIFIDQYLDRFEYLKRIYQADFVLLLYKNRGGSGVLLESISLGTVVFISRDRIWSNLIKESRGLVYLVTKRPQDISRDLINAFNQKTTLSNFSKREQIDVTTRPQDSLIEFIFGND